MAVTEAATAPDPSGEVTCRWYARRVRWRKTYMEEEEAQKAQLAQSTRAGAMRGERAGVCRWTSCLELWIARGSVARGIARLHRRCFRAESLDS